MTQQRFSSEEVKQIIKGLQFQDEAYIDFAQQSAPRIFEKVEIDLSVERLPSRPMKLGFAFKSVFVQDASDSSTRVSLRPYSQTQNNQAVSLRKNDTLNFDRPVQNAILSWDAQAGKKLTLIFIFNGTFRAGSLFTEVASAVEGNSFLVQPPISVGASPVKIINSNQLRSVLRIASDTDIFVGPSETGEFFDIGRKEVFRNTGELWARCVSGTATVNILEEQ